MKRGNELTKNFQNINRKRGYISLYDCCFFYVILAPIVPDWFAIIGIDARNFLALCLILAYLTFFSINHRIIVNFDKKFRFMLCVFLFWAFEQVFIYAYSENIMEGFYIILRCCIAPCIVMVSISTREQFIHMLKGIANASGIVAILGIVESITHFNVFSLLNNTGAILNYNHLRFGLLRIISSGNQTNSYCLYLMFMLSIVFYIIQISEKRSEKRKYVFVYLLLWSNVFLTLSRSMILISIALQLVLLYFSGFKKFIKSLSIIFICIIAILLCMSVVWPEMFEKISKIGYMFLAVFDSSYETMFASAMGENATDATGHRLLLYQWITKSMNGNWLLGNGMNTQFKYAYTNTNGIYNWTSYKYSIEVQVLNLLYHGGIVTAIEEFMLYIACIVQATKGMLKPAKWEKKISFSFVVFSICVAYFISLFSISRSSEWKLFCIIIALMCSYQNCKKFNFKE